MRRYNIRRILLELGYHEKSVLRVFNYYVKKYNLEIDKMENAAQEEVIQFLDCIAKKSIASIINNLNLYAVDEIEELPIVEEESSEGKVDGKVVIDKKSIQPEETDNQEERKESSHRVAKEERGNSRNQKGKKVRKSKLLAMKRNKLSKVTKRTSLSTTQKKHGSKKRARFLK